MLRGWKSGRIEDDARVEKLKTKLKVYGSRKRATEQRRRRAKSHLRMAKTRGEDKH